MVIEIWERATSAQPPLSWLLVLALGVGALVVTWTPLGYRMVRQVGTLIHEAGHALVAVLVGRRLSGIRLNSDTSGVTVSRGRRSGPGMVATLLAGYPAPALLGLGGAWLVSLGYAAGWLWLLVLLCAVMLVLIRNLYGLWVVLATGVAVAAVSWLAPGPVLTGMAYLLVWSLLLIAPRAVVDLQRARRRVVSGRGSARGATDADQLAALTRIPAVAWVAVFWLVCAGCLVAGGWLMLDAATGSFPW
ncbi:M50 family metallopeptidase [Citricoccus sp. NR2]|uniref:M50 family metallopeptidase n=1 Tax=Citricoccus sp. NR2 TaxID=3004095 RepID=UPI0022DD0E10|nr:M50 family metallopeptidase [Citricoccus sp. NR2]WBL19939.1 M50 family metallopeptidase [Citricoccus sp. NR2]